MKPRSVSARSVAMLWALARAGDFRRAADAAHEALRTAASRQLSANRVELHLVSAFCLMRQGDYAGALGALESASRAVALLPANAGKALRVAAWRAELAYFQGRYSDANRIVDFLVPQLENASDWAYVAFALRVRIAILLARADHDAALLLADRVIQAAETSADDYVIVQVLNILGAVHFDRATSKLDEPHARAHLSSLDPRDTIPMEADASEALRLFQRARTVAERSNNEFAAWYVAGNIERLEILLGHADRAIRPIRKRLAQMQVRGARYDEIVTRSNLAWALRTLGRYREALHELDVALEQARSTGISNVLLEFLEYDRSIVLDALGDTAAARASYRRYVQLVAAHKRSPGGSATTQPTTSPERLPLEPFFLKRADRFILEHVGGAFAVSELARHCGVSWRTLEKAFSAFRGISPVVYVRNVRLDHAHAALANADVAVAEVAARHGFRSSTTFALEYRKRFGTSPSKTKRRVG